jgi:hypothetical protein
MSFRPVFIAVVMACSVIVAPFLGNRARPNVETGIALWVRARAWSWS